MTTSTYPWAVFKTIHNQTSVKHFTTRDRARIYAASVTQDSRASAVIRRANRKNAEKWYARLAPVLALTNTEPVTKAAVVSGEKNVAEARRTVRKPQRVETLAFSFMEA